jgi:DNA primase
MLKAQPTSLKLSRAQKSEIWALFDNDTAGRSALRKLEQLKRSTAQQDLFA